MLKLAKNGIENGQLSEYLKLIQTTHIMQQRNPDKSRTTKVHQERLRTSSIPTFQKLLNMESKGINQE